MSSSHRNTGQNPDTTSARRMGASAKNGVDSAQNGPSFGSGAGYDQRRPHNYNEYGGGGIGVPSQQNVQVNGDYMNYYNGPYPMNDHYGWTTSGGNGGYYHHHPQAISSPVASAYQQDHLTLFGGGGGGGGGSGAPPTDHSSFYYNYFPPTNGSDYNTWGPNFVSAPRSGGGSSKPAEFYHSQTNDYATSGGYSRGNGSTHHLDQSMGRLNMYDDPLPAGGGSTGISSGGGGGGGYHRVSSASGESKKKSWASIAGQPAKQTSGIGLLGIGRGKGRGIPIGGVPGSAKTESYGGSTGSVESGGFWAPSATQNQLQPASTQRNAAATSPSVGIVQDKRSPRAVDSIRNMGNGKEPPSDYVPYSSSAADPVAYPKRRDTDTLNGAVAESDNGYDDRIVESMKSVPANFTQRPDNGAFSRKISADDYNPKEFTLPTKGARYFVIKSYSEDDVHRSIKYGIWCSTEHGNKRLDAAYREREGPIYLLFSVNGSGHFCGVAQMTSPLDYEKSSGVWAQDKWKGQFTVKWIYVKDVPNQQLRHIKLENNEGKPVTNSRDTQEVPAEKGRQVVKIIHQFTHSTSLFDDFAHYEKKQEEENARKGKRGTGNDY